MLVSSMSDSNLSPARESDYLFGSGQRSTSPCFLQNLGYGTSRLKGKTQEESFCFVLALPFPGGGKEWNMSEAPLAWKYKIVPKKEKLTRQLSPNSALLL